jgi:putative ABC transport system ATP-binding protein
MALITGLVITVEDVTRRFRRGPETVLALDGVSVELYGGELTVAAGPSGSGKTTLLSIIAGIERPDAGTVHTHPPLPAGQPPHRLGWRHLAFVPQALALLDELTVAENVALPARLDGSGDPEPDPDRTTAELLERLEIDQLAGRYPSHTSGGEQQRTALARALRLGPPLLLGDEPTGHQDRARIELLIEVLRQHAYQGNAVLLASHDQAVIAAADRVITLADGRITSDLRTETRSYG